jgi:N-acetylneuraminic acid mutarotase
MEDSNENLMT